MFAELFHILSNFFGAISQQTFTCSKFLSFDNEDKISINDFEKVNPNWEVKMLSLNADFFFNFSQIFSYIFCQLLKNMEKHKKVKHRMKTCLRGNHSKCWTWTMNKVSYTAQKNDIFRRAFLHFFVQCYGHTYCHPFKWFL